MIVEDWGLVPYKEALDQQLQYVELVSQDENHPGFLILCQHPAVVTTGRQTLPGDIFSWKGEIIDISRGGRATYHGPSQIVVYPILNLKKERSHRGPQEVRGYLRALEEGIVQTLAEYNINAVGRTIQKNSATASEADETGVWIGSQKIASLGIAIKKWITYHGAAINFRHDPSAFQGINPCGFNSNTMISIEQILKSLPNEQQFKSRLIKNLLNLL